MGLKMVDILWLIGVYYKAKEELEQAISTKHGYFCCLSLMVEEDLQLEVEEDTHEFYNSLGKYNPS